MGSYLGYGLMAGVQGFQSGFNMGQLKWQQNEKKRLAKKQEEMWEQSTIYNNMVAKAGEDGVYSDDDMMKINTAYMALSYEVKERIDGTYKAIQAMDKQRIEQNYKYFDMLPGIFDGHDPKDAQGMVDIVRPLVSGEKALLTFDALAEITRKKSEAAQAPKKVTPYEFYGESPAGVQVGIAESVVGQTPGLEGVEFKETPEVPAELSVAERKYNWATEAYQKGLRGEPGGISFEEYKRYMGVSVTSDKSTGLEKSVQDIITQGTTAGISQEEINTAVKNKILGKPTPELELKPETVTTLKNWEAMFDVNAEEGPRTEEEYNRALNLLAQSGDKYKPKYPTWKEALIAEVKGIGRELEEITDRTDRMFLLDVYKQKLEEIKAKYPDVDLTQFSQPKELSGWDKFLERVGL